MTDAFTFEIVLPLAVAAAGTAIALGTALVTGRLRRRVASQGRSGSSITADSPINENEGVRPPSKAVRAMPAAQIETIHSAQSAFDNLLRASLKPTSTRDLPEAFEAAQAALRRLEASVATEETFAYRAAIEHHRLRELIEFGPTAGIRPAHRTEALTSAEVSTPRREATATPNPS